MFIASLGEVGRCSVGVLHLPGSGDEKVSTQEFLQALGYAGGSHVTGATIGTEQLTTNVSGSVSGTPP
jgi:hypothetical protein